MSFDRYDPNGNRTKSTLGGADTTYLYSTGDQLTSETAGGVTTTYLYDANGALTKSDDGTIVNAYTYDYDGYQTAFDTTGTSNDGTYAYDAEKRRINKVVDSVTTKYFLGGSDVIADYDGDDELVATYVTPGLDSNLSQTRSGSTYYYMRDGLGSIRNVVDSSEATQNTYDYYAFGKELGTWTQNVTNRYTYTAREYDSEAKQYYYRARYYSGEGRFMGRDEFPPRGYAYVLSNPLKAKDPTGRSIFTPENGVAAMFPPFSSSKPYKCLPWQGTAPVPESRWQYAGVSFPHNVRSGNNGLGEATEVLCILKRTVVNTYSKTRGFWWWKRTTTKLANDTGIGYKVVPWKVIGNDSDFGLAVTTRLPLPIPGYNGTTSFETVDTFWYWVADDVERANSSCSSQINTNPSAVGPNPNIGLDFTGSDEPK